MTKSKVYGIRNRRKGALERLTTEKNTYEENKAKVPKRIEKEINILTEKLKYNGNKK